MLTSCLVGKAQDKSSEWGVLTFCAGSGRQALSILKKGKEMAEKGQVTPVTFPHYTLSRIQSVGHA